MYKYFFWTPLHRYFPFRASVLTFPDCNHGFRVFNSLNKFTCLKSRIQFSSPSSRPHANSFFVMSPSVSSDLEDRRSYGSKQTHVDLLFVRVTHIVQARRPYAS
ncbi:hypothetical protein LXL04_025660 [Taraxacum kok-saghyz]